MQRIMKPLVLSLILVGLLATSASAQFTVNVIGTNNPLTNGANLLAAIAGIPPTAGPNQPWLVKVDAGIYDLGGNQIVMRNFVDIEGSGRNVTYITSDGSLVPSFNPATIRVPANTEAELSELTVRSTATGAGTGVSIVTDDFLMDEVNVEVETGGDGTGVSISGFSPRLNEVFVRGSAGGSDTGIMIDGGAPPITESFVFVSSFGGKNIGILIDNGSAAVLERVVVVTLFGEANWGVVATRQSAPELNNVRASATGGDDARGLYVFKEATPEVKESTFTASSDTLAIALSLEQASVQTTESTYRATPITFDHFGVFAVQMSGPSTLNANQSNFDGSAFAVSNAGSGVASFGASQLIGQAISTSLGGLRCIYAYNGTYTARNAFCQ